MSKEKKLSKRIIKKAAILWSLALIIHTDSVADTDVENAVRDEARRIARDKLDRLDLAAGEILCEQDAIYFARQMVN